MNIEDLNLFDYADFRKFLADYQKIRHEQEGSFSKSEFCRQLGLPNTRSFLGDVISNGKSISKNYVERFIRVMKLDKEESLFFRVLVQFNQSQQEDERDLLFDQLVSLNRTPKRFVDKKAFAYYRKWYHSAIFSLLDVFEISDDYKFLSKKVFPPVTTKQARDSIKLMKDLGIIKKNELGMWKATDRAITTGPYVKNELIKQYQLQCLDLAKQVMLSPIKKPHNISTMTVSISDKGYKLIEKKLQKFKSELRSIVHKESEPSQNVYQINIQYFPQSQ